MQHSPSDGSAAQHSTKRRDARKAKLTQLFGTTDTLFGDLETITALCWATHKLLTGHGLEQQSRTLAAHVQVLQSCCDANRELLVRYDPSSKQRADTDNPTDTQQALHTHALQQEQGHAGQLPAHPPQILQILHGSTSASSLSSNGSSSSSGGCSSSGSAERRQPGPPPPPPPLPPGQGSFLRPIPGKPRLLGSAAQQAAQGAAAGGAKPPPPPPGPPPPHQFLAAAAAAAGPGSNSSDSRSSSSRRSGSAPPPPPPGPPPPHAFKTKEQPASTSSTRQQPQQQRQRQGLRPPPPPPPLPPGALSVSHTPVKLDSSSPAPPPGPPAAAAAAPAGGRGPGGGQPAGKAPPPPPPLPPLGFNSLKAPSARPSTAPGACSCSSDGSGPGSSSRSSGSPLQGINAIAAAAAAAGARRAQQDGGTEPSTPTRATGLLPHSSSFSGVLSPPQQCTTAEGGGGAGGSSCGKLKRLHVDPVPRHRMTDGSFWRQTEDVVQPFKAEVEYALRCMFSNTPAAGRRAADGAGGGADGPAAEDAAGRVIKVIPDKRALQVEVCIKRLRMDAPELAAALNRIDTDKLKQDDLPQIRSMLPKPDELAQVTAAKKRALREHRARLAAAAAADGSNGSNGDGCSGDANRSAAAAVSAPPPLPPRLGVVEAAFEALGGVRMLMAKMRACEFKYDVEAVSAQVDDFVRDLSVCLDAFRTCGQLQDLLAFVRSIANTMNASSAAGQAEGLKLESLARLQATRVPGSTDLNMLHFIVAQLTTSMPYALELEAEREAFKAVTKRGTFDTMLTRVRGLADMHKRISGDLTKAWEHLKHTSNSPQQPARNSSSSTGDAGDSSSSSPGAAATGSARATKPAAAAAADGSGSVTPRPPVAAGSSSSGSVTATPATPAAAASPDAADAEQQQVYVERVTQLLADSGVKLGAMQHKMDDAIRQFRFTVEYFCEDAALGWKQQPAAFIAHFSDLLEAIEAARKDTGRVAKVLKIVTQHIEDKARKEEEEADAAAAAAAAAAAESGVQLGWDGDEQQQLLEAYEADYWAEEDEEQQQHVTPCYDADSSPDEAPTAEVRLTRTSSWVLGVARSLQFDAPGGSTDAAEGELLLGGGRAASSCCGDCGGEEAEEAGAPQQSCLSGDGSTARHSGGSGGGRVTTEGADSEVQQQQQAGGHVLAGPPAAAAAPGEQQRQQQQEAMVLPDLQWQGLDLLSGIWGSSMSVLTPDEQDASARSSSNGSGAVGGDVQKCAAATAPAAPAAAAALDGAVP